MRGARGGARILGGSVVIGYLRARRASYGAKSTV
jgi:hypothetical protein